MVVFQQKIPQSRLSVLPWGAESYPGERGPTLGSRVPPLGAGSYPGEQISMLTRGVLPWGAGSYPCDRGPTHVIGVPPMWSGSYPGERGPTHVIGVPPSKCGSHPGEWGPTLRFVVCPPWLGLNFHFLQLSTNLIELNLLTLGNVTRWQSFNENLTQTKNRIVEYCCGNQKFIIDIISNSISSFLKRSYNLIYKNKWW